MVINIDIDNTINDFIYKFIKHLNGLQSGHHKFEIEDFTEYNLSKSTGLDQESLEVLFYKNNSFHETLDPLCGSVPVISLLVDSGHDVRFVSSISYDAIQSRIDFMRKYFPFMYPDKQLIITHDKASIYADIVIDDHLKHLNNINKDCKFILFDQPWNKDCKIPAIRVYDWFGVKDVLDELGVFGNGF